MKKLLLFLFALAFIFTACDNADSGKSKDEKKITGKKKDKDEDNEDEDEDETDEEDEDEDGDDEEDEEEDERSNRWSAKDRKEYTDECIRSHRGFMESSKIKKYCFCLLGKWESKFPSRQAADDAEMPDLSKWISECK